MKQRDEYEKAMRCALRRRPLFKSDGKYLTREDLHDRAKLRAGEQRARKNRSEAESNASQDSN